MRNRFLFVTLLVFCAAAQLHAEEEKEYVILTGGVSLYQWEKFKMQPHDGWWANFVRASRLRIEQIRAQEGPDAKITWLVYLEGYKRRSEQEKRDLLPLITSVRDAFNTKLVLFDTAQGVI